MTRRDAVEKIKAFGMTNQIVNDDLARIGSLYGLELGHVPNKAQAVEDVYYRQFDQSVRKEAADMARHYAIFYCLETSIRKLVSETLEEARGANWWDEDCVPKLIHDEVEKRVQKELNAGISRRSYEELDYTTFGELAVLINDNWDVFGGTFTTRRAVEKVMSTLNSLRNPIAHCTPLAEDEIVRLNLTVRDWFRLMEAPA